MMPGYRELIIIFFIVLILFGGKKIPEVARGLGKGMREFRKAREDIQDALDDAMIEPPAETRVEEKVTVASADTAGPAPEAQAGTPLIR